jgi:hypothetical protein
MCEVAFHCDDGNLLRIALNGRTHPDADDYWDGNWLQASVTIQAGGFHGSVDGDLRTEELARFLEQLADVQKTLSGTAEFHTMEEWLSIRVTGNGRGHMTIRCVVWDAPGVGNTLECQLTADQTFTKKTVEELAAAVKAYPVAGMPRQ